MAAQIGSSLPAASKVLIARPPGYEAREASRSLKSMPLRRAGDAHAPALALPAPGAVLRRRFAGVVAIGEHDHVAQPRAAGRGREGPRSRAPPMPACPVACMAARQVSMPSPTISTSLGLGRAAPRRRDTARASSSPARPAPCRCRRGRERCGEWRSAFRRRHASRARPSPARCRPRDVSGRHGSAGRRSRKVEPARTEIGLRPAFPRPACDACQIASAASLRFRASASGSSTIRCG